MLFYVISLVQDEDEVPDDETINQMLARTEVEYEKFQVDSHVWRLRHVFSFFGIVIEIFIYQISILCCSVAVAV